MCSLLELKLAVNLWCNLTWRWLVGKWLPQRSEVAKMQLRSLSWRSLLKLSSAVNLRGSCSSNSELRRPTHFAALLDLLFAGCWVREKRSELQSGSGCPFVGSKLKRGPKSHFQQKSGSEWCHCNYFTSIGGLRHLGAHLDWPDSRFFTGSSRVQILVEKSGPKSRQLAWKQCPELKLHSRHNSGSQSRRNSCSLDNPGSQNQQLPAKLPVLFKRSSNNPEAHPIQ